VSPVVLVYFLLPFSNKQKIAYSGDDSSSSEQTIVGNSLWQFAPSDVKRVVRHGKDGVMVSVIFADDVPLELMFENPGVRDDWIALLKPREEVFFFCCIIP